MSRLQSLRNKGFGAALLLLMLGVSGADVCCAADDAVIGIGDSTKELTEKLGPIKGRMRTGKDVVLLFKRGTVTIRDDKVVAFKLDSIARLAQREKARAAREAARAEAQKAAASRKQDDEAALAKHMQDAELSAKPPAVQLAFWKAFQEAHPGVSVAEKIAGLEAQVNKKAGPTEREKLEKRIALIEAEYTTWKGKTGLSRRGLRIRSKKLWDLEKQIATLKAKHGALPQEAPAKTDTEAATGT